MVPGLSAVFLLVLSAMTTVCRSRSLSTDDVLLVQKRRVVVRIPEMQNPSCRQLNRIVSGMSRHATESATEDAEKTAESNEVTDKDSPYPVYRSVQLPRYVGQLPNYRHRPSYIIG